MSHEPETIHTHFGAEWAAPRPMDNRFDPTELFPRGRAWIVREQDSRRGVDVGAWDVLGGQAKWPMTNVRQLGLPQWRCLADRPINRCLIPLTEFAEWTPEAHDVRGGKPIKGEMWFSVTDQPVFAVAGLCQQVAGKLCWAMVTCDPNALVAPVHPKAMVTVLEQADWDTWLRGTYSDAVALQRLYPARAWRCGGPVFPTRAGKAASR